MWSDIIVGVLKSRKYVDDLFIRELVQRHDVDLSRLFSFAEILDDVDGGRPGADVTRSLLKVASSGLQNVILELDVASPWLDWGDDDGTVAHTG